MTTDWENNSIDRPIVIRFVGEDLEKVGVPIVELSESLLAIQHMFYKAYAADIYQGKSNKLTDGERWVLSLYMSGQAKRSDIYLFDWVAKVASDFPQEVANHVGIMLLGALGSFLKESPLNIFQKHQKETQDILAMSVFNELGVLTERIGQKKGIERIELYFSGQKKPVTIDENTKKMVKNIRGKAIQGEAQDLIGWISRANMEEKNWIELNTSGRKIKVYVSEKLFDHSMSEYVKRKDERPIFKILGNPRLFLGRDIFEFTDFDAIDIKLLVENGRLQD